MVARNISGFTKSASTDGQKIPLSKIAEEDQEEMNGVNKLTRYDLVEVHSSLLSLHYRHYHMAFAIVIAADQKTILNLYGQ